MKLNDIIKVFSFKKGNIIFDTLIIFLNYSFLFGCILIVSFIFENKQDTIDYIYVSIFCVLFLTIGNLIIRIINK